MSDLVELVANGRVERWMSVTVDVAPERADAVEVTIPVVVEQINAFAALDDQRRPRRPIGLRREGMPEMVAVPRAKRLG